MGRLSHSNLLETIYLPFLLISVFFLFFLVVGHYGSRIEEIGSLIGVCHDTRGSGLVVYDGL